VKISDSRIFLHQINPVSLLLHISSSSKAIAIITITFPCKAYFVKIILRLLSIRHLMDLMQDIRNLIKVMMKVYL